MVPSRQVVGVEVFNSRGSQSRSPSPSASGLLESQDTPPATPHVTAELPEGREAVAKLTPTPGPDTSSGADPTSHSSGVRNSLPELEMDLKQLLTESDPHVGLRSTRVSSLSVSADSNSDSLHSAGLGTHLNLTAQTARAEFRVRRSDSLDGASPGMNQNPARGITYLEFIRADTHSSLPEESLSLPSPQYKAPATPTHILHLPTTRKGVVGRLLKRLSSSSGSASQLPEPAACRPCR